MSEVIACSLGVQRQKILHHEDIITTLFVAETQLEWVSSVSSPLIMRPFLSPLASPVFPFQVFP